MTVKTYQSTPPNWSKLGPFILDKKSILMSSIWPSVPGNYAPWAIVHIYDAFCIKKIWALEKTDIVIQFLGVDLG